MMRGRMQHCSSHALVLLYCTFHSPTIYERMLIGLESSDKTVPQLPTAVFVPIKWCYFIKFSMNRIATYVIPLKNLFLSMVECRVRTDLIFVLDSSASIGTTSYQRVRTFVSNFTNGLKIGAKENQVGVIIFSDSSEIAFNLNTYHVKEDLLNAISNIRYIGGYTHTAAGLRQLVDDGFTREAGARLESATVLRLAVVMTDGRSNINATDTLIAAERVHAFRPAILVYVVGVTGNVNEVELNTIATAPEFIDRLESFDASLLQESQEERAYEICFTGLFVQHTCRKVL